MHPKVNLVYLSVFLVFAVIWILILINVLNVGIAGKFVLLILTTVIVLSYISPPKGSSISEDSKDTEDLFKGRQDI